MNSNVHSREPFSRGYLLESEIPRGPEGSERRKGSTSSISCGACGARWTAFVRGRIRVEKWPSAREALLARRFGAYACPRCRVPARFEEDLLYHDGDRRIMAWVLPPREGAAFRDAPDPPPDPSLTAHLARLGYRFRVVHSTASLREKVLVLEAGLDDRWFEYVRAAASENAARAWGDRVALEVEEVSPGWEVRFRLAGGGRRGGAGYHLTWASYLAIEAEGRATVGDLVASYEPGVAVVDGGFGDFLLRAQAERTSG